MTLVRNEHWNSAADPIRKAYPDRWVVQLGLDPKLVDTATARPLRRRRVRALARGRPAREPVDGLCGPLTVRPEFEGRAVSEFDPYSAYFWINVEKVSSEKIRQAMLGRHWTARGCAGHGGGSRVRDLVGDYADGAIKPSIGLEYAPTRGIWTRSYGKTIPPSGDPELATAAHRPVRR